MHSTYFLLHIIVHSDIKLSSGYVPKEKSTGRNQQLNKQLYCTLEIAVKIFEDLSIHRFGPRSR